MNMRLKKRLLFLPILVAVLAGCSSLTHSPIVFTSRQTIGVDIRPTASDTRTPGVAIGIRNSDFAWVPAVGIGGCAKWKDEKKFNVEVKAEDRNFTTEDWRSKCEIQTYVPHPVLAHSQEFYDVFSVYGQFDAEVGGFGPSGDQKLAKVFAVGLAAQMYTNVASARVRNECLEAIDKLMAEKIEKSTDADVQEGTKQIAVLLKQQCGVISRGGKK